MHGSHISELGAEDLILTEKLGCPYTASVDPGVVASVRTIRSALTTAFACDSVKSADQLQQSVGKVGPKLVLEHKTAKLELGMVNLVIQLTLK